jgi:transcriptional regulator with XRE-family HTH domain
VVDIFCVRHYKKVTMIPDPIYKSVGLLIKARRKALGLKQENLAHTMRISRGSLANIETGKQGILLHQLYKFANALELRVTDLLPEETPTSTATERAKLPLPGDLPVQQNKQLADLILQVDTSKSTNKEMSHAKKSISTRRRPPLET